MSEDPNRRVSGEALPDPLPSREVIRNLTDTAQFRVELDTMKEVNKGIKETQGKLFDKIETINVNNSAITEKLDHIQNSNASMATTFGIESESNRKKIEEVMVVGDRRKEEIKGYFNDKMSEFSDIVKIDREKFEKEKDEREAQAEAKDKIKVEEELEELKEKKKTRNKILVKVATWLIISAIGFISMILWLGFKTYLKYELNINGEGQTLKIQEKQKE